MLKHFTYIHLTCITAAPNILPRNVPDKRLLKEFTFQLFEIGQTVELIKRKVKAWPEMIVPIGPFQILNHGHARKEQEDYLDYRWFPSPIQQHDPKVLILSHFRKLGLATLYQHQVPLNDTFFEDTKLFENAIRSMRLRHILEERIVVLSEDPDLERMEWCRQCFEAKPSEEKDEESDKDKEKDEETDKEKEREKEKSDEPSDKEKLSLKETTLLRPKDTKVDKEIPPRFDLKSTVDPRSKGQDPKDV